MNIKFNKKNVSIINRGIDIKEIRDTHSGSTIKLYFGASSFLDDILLFNDYCIKNNPTVKDIMEYIKGRNITVL